MSVLKNELAKWKTSPYHTAGTVSEVFVAVEFDHGLELVPAAINGIPTRYATVDGCGAVVAWASDAPPVFGQGAWQLGCDDHVFTGRARGVEHLYTGANRSLRAVEPTAILQRALYELVTTDNCVD